MLKSQLVISLTVFLFLSLERSSARFLQNPTTKFTQDVGISPVENHFYPTLEQANIAYNVNLTCGECVVGGYVYCVNGPEGFTGSIAPRGTCCRDSRNCTQITTPGWICSSKYDNMTLIDKLRVCPFNQAQCGNQSLSFNELGDSQCLRLRNLTKGSSCLYRVQSRCGVPRFQVNDTSSDIYTSTLLIANRTLDSVLQTDRCSATRN